MIGIGINLWMGIYPKSDVVADVADSTILSGMPVGLLLIITNNVFGNPQFRMTFNETRSSQYLAFI